MMNYLIIANIYLILFYGFYKFFLARETFFQVNRAYLIGTTSLSFILPLIQLEWLQDIFRTSTVFVARSSLDAVTIYAGDNVDSVNAESGIAIPFWGYIYMSGLLVQLILVIRKFIHLKRRLQTTNEGDAYSFMHAVKVDVGQQGSSKILRHELIHVRQFHTLDVLFLELIKLFNWFNPVVYWLANSLKLTHEYIADEAVNTSQADKIAYAELLISRTFSVSSSVLTNNFLNQSFIKNRIVMLLKNKSRRPALLKYVLAVPLFISMLIFSSAKVSDKAERLTELALGKAEVENFYKLVGTQVRYLDNAKANEVQGAVDVAFVKEADNLEAKVLNTISDGQGAEVLRVLRLPEVVKEMPEGKHVLRVKFLLVGTTVKEKLDVPLTVPAGYQQLEEVVVVGKPTSPEKAKESRDGIPSPKIVQVKSARSNKDIPPPQVVLVRTDTTKTVMDFNKVEKQPQFPGGLHAFYKWIGEQYKYPAEAKTKGIAGTLHVSFVVELDGSLSEIELLKDLGHGTGEAAIALLKESPKWAPGLMEGKPVRVYYTLPIKLNLSNPKPQEKTGQNTSSL
ncbi:energy transducer TonB [Olivibacter sp. CPCC 100613]|uniref:energy transducer TonB n=1 Tax=Olivibacter sp. CPCC 100613 TaxID=3079931 RepID=UPI002FF4BF77